MACFKMFAVKDVSRNLALLLNAAPGAPVEVISSRPAFYLAFTSILTVLFRVA